MKPAKTTQILVAQASQPAVIRAWAIIRHLPFVIRHSPALLATLLMLCTSCATPKAVPSPAPPATPKTFSGASPLTWSQRLADSEIARRGDSLDWKPNGRAKWDYAAGLFTLSLLHLNETLAQNAGRSPANPPFIQSPYVQFSKNAIGSFVGFHGEVRTYNRNEFQLDSLNSGKTALALWRLTGDARYHDAAQVLDFQLVSQPQTPEGGFWHKQRYTNQMWLDGIYMAAPFHLECGQVFAQSRSVSDVARQLRLIDEHTYDAKTGLNYHAWDAAKIQPWANPQTGCSSNFWGRAEGWYVMALVDILDYFPTNHPARAQILATLQKTARGIVPWQDAQTGLWWQVLDQGGRPGNYLEASASAMFVAALAKGVNRGYLSREYVPAITKGYAGLVDHLLRNDGNGQWSLTHCCSVAGLGFKTAAGRPRDGSYEYYLSEPVVDNDLKAVGPFILAGIELERW